MNKSDRQGDFFDEYKPEETALVVNEGVEQPPIINPYLSRILKKRNSRPTMTVDDYMKGIIEGNTIILSKAITLVESSLPEHREMAKEIIIRCLEHSKRKESMRIGITGVPGAGKSTFIEAFGGLVTSKGHKLAVLAIDPSSEKTKGSILGDKTRMETLCNDPNAFIRPSPSAGSLGGVARKTRESVLLCEAAGYDVVFIETVGVGQSETAVHSMSDFFLLLQISGAGDDLQGIKRGIMEMSDLIMINKADGNNIEKANMARAVYANALHLFPPTESGWVPTALAASSIEKTGLEEVWAVIEKYFNLVKGNGYYSHRRREQDRYWMYESINNSLKEMFYENPKIEAALPDFEQAVLEGKIDSFSAASELLNKYRG
jgi:LAO/AO transport system kinase